MEASTSAYGDQFTNMRQPFWALPLLGITGVKARDMFCEHNAETRRTRRRALLEGVQASLRKYLYARQHAFQVAHGIEVFRSPWANLAITCDEEAYPLDFLGTCLEGLPLQNKPCHCPYLVHIVEHESTQPGKVSTAIEDSQCSSTR